MATKRISELTLRSDVDDTCNLPVDDTLQSYRVTALQVYNYIKAKLLATTGDMIYSSSGSTPAKLAIGSTGQILTVAGGLPTWATPAVFPGSFQLSVYYPGSSSNYWSRAANASYGDFSVTGTIPTPTTIRNASFGTISKATSNLPGIAFTAPRTGIIKITTYLAFCPTQSALVSSWSVKLLESVTSTDVSFAGGSTTKNDVNNLALPITMVGYFAATVSTAYNFKIQSATGQGTGFIGASNFENCLGFTMEYIT